MTVQKDATQNQDQSYANYAQGYGYGMAYGYQGYPPQGQSYPPYSSYGNVNCVFSGVCIENKKCFPTFLLFLLFLLFLFLFANLRSILDQHRLSSSASSRWSFFGWFFLWSSWRLWSSLSCSTSRR